MESSTESAITSRETRLAFMPWWPMAMPSVTVMVLNRNGVPPAARTPPLAMSACALSVVLQGALSLPALTTPTKGLAMSSAVIPIA